MNEITKENLIDIVCQWMNTHNSDELYISETSKGKKYINGRYQTDLRSFIRDVLLSNIPYWDAIYLAKSKN